jgi:glucose/arabinose dehydrogenase
LAVLAALIGLPFAAPPARALPPSYSLQLVHSQLALPTTIRFAPDGRLFYTELFTGRIMVYSNPTAPQPTHWATVPTAGSGEHGVLGMAFHPDFPDSAYLYVFHTGPTGIHNRIARLREQNGVGTGYTILVDNLYANAQGRFGGRLAFGPDRNLYVTIGDCCIPASVPDPSNVLGKILRLGLTGKPALGNPYGGNNPVCAVGVRNPYGLCFDPVTGYGYFTDNGPLCDDEVNRLQMGVNYGWGALDFCGGQPAGTYEPMISFTPTLGMTGCTVYRGSAYPQYAGNLFVGVCNTGSIQRVVFHSYPTMSEVDSVEVWATVPYPDTQILDVTTGPDGRIWFSTFDQIWRVFGPPSGPVGVAPARDPEALTVSPNPSSGQVRFALHGDAAFDGLDLVDVSGRSVRRWSGPVLGAVEWDGRDDAGQPVAAGVYWIRGQVGGRSITRCVVRIAR